MKRLLALALCMMFAIGTLAGCGQKDSDAKVMAKIIEIDLTSEPVSDSLDPIGGAAEDVAEYSITVNFNGKGTEITSS